MKTIKINKPMLIGSKSYSANSIVEVPEDRAKHIVDKGDAEYSEHIPKVETAKMEPPKAETQTRKTKKAGE